MKWFSLRRLLRLFAWVVPIGVTLIILLATSFIFQTDYPSLLNQILESIHRPDIATRVKTEFFTEKKFHLLKNVLVFVSIIFTLLLGCLYAFRKAYHRYIDSISSACHSKLIALKKMFSELKPSTKWLFGISMIIIALRSIYYASHFYIQYDEAWNYNLFLDKQFYYSIGAYNNYPLHNLVTWSFVHLFGNSVFVLRLPSICIGLATCFAIFVSIVYFFKNEKAALILTGIFACLPVSVFYMMYSRGVMFEIFFSILVISYLLKSLSTQVSFYQMLILAILNALGSYSMISHFYFILATGVSFFIIAIFRKREWLGYSVLYLVLSVGISLLLYLPMMLGTGLGPGMSAGFKHQTLSFMQIHQGIINESIFLTGVYFLLPIAFILHVIVIIKTWNRNFSFAMLHLFSLGLLSLLIVIPLCTGTILPERAMSFLIISFLALMIIPFCMPSEAILGKQIQVFFGLSCMLFFSYKSHTHHFLNWSKKLDEYVYKASLQFKNHQIKRAYNDCRDFDYFIPGIEYYYKQNHQEIEFLSSAQSSTRYTAQIPEYINCLIDCGQSRNNDSLNKNVIFSVKNIQVFYREQERK